MTDYLSLRLQLLDSAIAAAPGGALLDALNAEQTALKNAQPWEVSERTYLNVAQTFTLGARTTGPLGFIESDPVPQALGTPLMPPDINEAILNNLPPTETLVPPDFLAQVRALCASDDVFDQLVMAAHHLWLLGEHSYLYDDVGVLLPLRLETRFDPTDAGIMLSLRIIPDEASICRDVTTVTHSEVAALNALWNDLRAYVPDPATPLAQWFQPDESQRIWERFCARFSPQRAAWLVSTFLPRPDSLDAPVVEVPDERIDDRPALVNRVGGLPEQIDVWALYGAADSPTRKLLASLRPKPGLTLDLGQQVALLENIERGTPPPAEEQPWWISWEAAKAVQMGVECLLPDDCTPENIVMLYAIGIGDEPPAAHFRSQVDAGELALIPLGQPTNAVSGGAVVDLGTEPETWRQVVMQRLDAAAPVGLLARFNRGLLGDAAALPFMPGGDLPLPDNRLVAALWPALWGHSLKDLWRWGETEIAPEARRVEDHPVDHLALWAFNNLYPEGALPPIRINRQPYGLLPTTTFSAWQVEPRVGVARVESLLVPGLVGLRAAWANAARKRGTIAREPANAEETPSSILLDLLGQDGLTHDFIYRLLLSADVLALVEGLLGHPSSVREELRRALSKAHESATQIMKQDALAQGFTLEQVSDALRFYGPFGDPAFLRLPLVVPTQKPDAVIPEVIELLMQERESYYRLLEEKLRALPDSLLIRLIYYATILAQAHLGQVQQALQGIDAERVALLNPAVLFPGESHPTRIERMSLRSLPGDPATDVPQRVFDTVRHRLMEQAKELQFWLYEVAGDTASQQQRAAYLRATERGLRATLDTAAHRIDPWLTGMAWRRLSASAGPVTSNYRMGVYGWLEGPFAGTPGPTRAGRLHAPSHAQALTSIILRDKDVATGETLWHMNLDSQVIRLADEIGEEVRVGSHLYEALGRRLERVIGTSAGVATLRAVHPLRPSHPDANTACDGMAWLFGNPKLETQFPALAADQQDEIALLRRVVDAYGDLLVSEAVHNVVAGRAEVAGAPLDSAAGLGQPPTLEFVRTVDAGYTLNTSVLVMLPYREAADTDAPAALVDASAAASLETRFGAPETWRWRVRWSWLDEQDIQNNHNTIITLADLGLETVEMAALPISLLRAMCQTLAQSRFVPDPGEAYLQLSAEVEEDDPDRLDALRKFVGLLGKQPPAAAHLDPVASDGLADADARRAAADAHRAARAALDTTIIDNLKARYAALRGAAQTLLADLAAAGDSASRQAALRRVLRWGLLPMPDSSGADSTLEAILIGALPDDDALLADAASKAQAQVQARLDAAPLAPAALQDCLNAMTALAAPDGQLAILARVPASVLQQAGLVSAPTLDAAWLTLVAPVRARLATLESWQLEAAVGLSAAPWQPWCSRPGDPWLRDLIAQSESGRRASQTLELPRLMVAYEVDGALASGTAAVGLLDSWSEVVPTTRRSTTAAFGFNAPAARPPQAILLAVPPVVKERLSSDSLLETLIETHELMQARAARFEDLGAYYPLMPSTMFAGMGVTGIRLDENVLDWTL